MLRAPAVFRQLISTEGSNTFTYVIGDVATKTAVVIDPVIEHVERDAALIKELGMDPVFLLNTHVHADHATGTGLLKKHFPGAKSVLGKAGNEDCLADVKADHGQVLKVGEQEIEVRSTPGHTNGCVTYVWSQRGAPVAAFTGDALLIRGCGRTDFQQGSSTKLYKSVHEQVFSLPDDVAVFPAHDYRGMTMSTVGEEKKHNPRLTKPQAEFDHIMANLNLAKPKKIDESLPLNRVCGLHELLPEGSSLKAKMAAADNANANVNVVGGSKP